VSQTQQPRQIPASSQSAFLRRDEVGTYSTSKVALCSVSAFFCASFAGEFSERRDKKVLLHVSCDEARVWKAVLDAALLREVPSGRSVKDMLTAAKLSLRWLMPGVGMRFLEALDQRASLQTIEDINQMADLCSEIEAVCKEADVTKKLSVVSRCEAFLVERFSQLELCWRGNGLLQLASRAFQILLQSNNLQVDTEESLWEIILEWGAVSPARQAWLAEHHCHGFAFLKVPFLSSTFMSYAVCTTIPASIVLTDAMQALSFMRAVGGSNLAQSKHSFQYYTKYAGKQQAKQVEWQFQPRNYVPPPCASRRIIVFKCRRQLRLGLHEYRPVASKVYGQIAEQHGTTDSVLMQGPVIRGVLCGGGLRMDQVTFKLSLDGPRASLSSTLEVRAADWSERYTAGRTAGPRDACNGMGAGAAASATDAAADVIATTASPGAEVHRGSGESCTTMPRLGLCAFQAFVGLIARDVALGADAFPALEAGVLARSARVALHAGLDASKQQFFASTQRAVDICSQFRDSIWGYGSIQELEEQCVRRMRATAGEAVFTSDGGLHLDEGADRQTEHPEGEEAYVFVVLRLSSSSVSVGT